MVDSNLPFGISGDRRLRYLFLDLNAYFASVEQQVDPTLRGKPIVVAPVDTDTTCAIAASYEAKAYGIKTGTIIGEARKMCKDLIVVPAQHTLYVHYHNLVIEAAETILPVDKVCSIDEMQFKLLGDERLPDQAQNLARRIKTAIRERAGECMTSSIGIAPNAFLAKLGTDMMKPDGLVVLELGDIPAKLVNLKLTDFCGINKRMAARLQASGIFTIEELYARSPAELRAAFGSISGERWYYQLRGYDMPLEISEQKSLSHSSVLSPKRRTDHGCREVLLRLIQKASARLRSNNLCASSMSVGVSAFRKSWKSHTRLSPTNDTVTFNDEFFRLWSTRDFEGPRSVHVVFTDLSPADSVTPSLFDFSIQRDQLNRAVDNVNQKFGKNSVFLAAIEGAKDSATEKIAFNKTWLFSEGKGDNEWVNTFTGPERKQRQEESDEDDEEDF